MLLSILYAVVRLLLDLALLRCRSATGRDLELLALRHAVRVLRRRTTRMAWRPGDRLVLTALSRYLPRANWHAFPVRPETLLRWHRELIRRKWAAFGRRRGPGRPPLAVPAEERLRSDGERLPAGAGEATAQGREHQAVARAPGEPFGAGSQDAHLVA